MQWSLKTSQKKIALTAVIKDKKFKQMFIVLLVDDDILVIFGSHFYLICDFQYRFAKVFSYIFRSN